MKNAESFKLRWRYGLAALALLYMFVGVSCALGDKLNDYSQSILGILNSKQRFIDSSLERTWNDIANRTRKIMSQVGIELEEATNVDDGKPGKNYFNLKRYNERIEELRIVYNQDQEILKNLNANEHVKLRAMIILHIDLLRLASHGVYLLRNLQKMNDDRQKLSQPVDLDYFDEDLDLEIADQEIGRLINETTKSTSSGFKGADNVLQKILSEYRGIRADIEEELLEAYKIYKEDPKLARGWLQPLVNKDSNTSKSFQRISDDVTY